MLQRYRANFLSTMSAMLPALISRKRIVHEQEYGDCLEMIFLTSQKIPIEDVKKMFTNDAHLYILYQCVKNDSVRGMQSCCAFSRPTNACMYKINVTTDADEMVSEVTVLIYEDLEFYTSKLLDDLKIQAKNGTFKVAMKRAEILQISL